jgi:hypothetical protein
VESLTTKDVVGLHPANDSNNGNATNSLLAGTDLECLITAKEQLLLPKEQLLLPKEQLLLPDECVDT